MCLKNSKVCGHVQRKPVSSNATSHLHADGRDLPVVHPNAGWVSFRISRDSKLLESAQHHSFQRPYILQRSAAPASEVDDWIADKLARPVVRHFSAPIGVEHPYPKPVEFRSIDQYVVGTPASAERKSVRVLQ